jgi:hypothetical protein
MEAIERLRKSSNPDAIVLDEFRTNLKNYSTVKEAANRTAKTFRIDVSDVVDIVKEANLKKKSVIEKSDNWIKDATKNKGKFSKKAKRAGMSTQQYAEKEKHAGGKLGKEANLALNLKKISEETKKKASSLKKGDVIIAGKQRHNVVDITHGSQDGTIKVKHSDGGNKSSEPAGTSTYKNDDIVLVEKSKTDPCWKGYKQIGMKKKKGKEVPNCVPVKEAVPFGKPDYHNYEHHNFDHMSDDELTQHHDESSLVANMSKYDHDHRYVQRLRREMQKRGLHAPMPKTMPVDQERRKG